MNEDKPFESLQMAKASLILTLRRHGIVDKAILRAFELVPHEEFIPDEYLSYAYRDLTLPIGYGQSITSPTHLANMLVPLEPEGAAKIFEIGTGSGYCAALLSTMAKRIFTLERIDELAKQAEKNWQRAEISGVIGFNLDGLLGLGGHQPFDRILLSGSVREISYNLLEQLSDGGILVGAVGKADERQIITRVERIDDDFLFSEHGFIRLAPLISGKYRN